MTAAYRQLVVASLRYAVVAVVATVLFAIYGGK